MIDLRKKLKQLEKYDWWQRVAVVGTAAAVVTAVVAILFYVYIGHRASERATAERAEMLTEWLSEENIDALSGELPEDADIGTIAGQRGVKKVLLFDAGGRVFAPLSMHGGQFADKKFFSRVRTGGKTVMVADGDGNIEVFRPITGGAASAGSFYGMAYLVIDKEDRVGLFYPIALIVIIATAFFLFIVFVVKETSLAAVAVASARPGRRYDLLEKCIKERVGHAVKDAVHTLEDQWRKLVHSLPYPVIVLDANCRLVELNEAAMAHFGDHQEYVEGRHVVDILGGNGQHRSIVEVLEQIANQPDNGFVRFKDKDMTVSAFASASDLVNFKYTIVYSGGRGD